MYKIRDDLKVTRKSGYDRRYPILDLEIGHSFLFPIKEIKNVRRSVYYANKRYGKIFIVQKFSENEGICLREDAARHEPAQNGKPLKLAKVKAQMKMLNVSVPEEEPYFEYYEYEFATDDEARAFYKYPPTMKAVRLVDPLKSPN